MIQITMIDHYDSFTYNIVHYLKDFNLKVFYPHQIDWKFLENSSHVIFSPGYGHPKEMKHSLKILEKIYLKKPILGICLGHQIIAHFFNSKVCRLKNPFHGKTSVVTHYNSSLFQGIPNQFQVGRYHSLCVKNLQEPLRVNCLSDDGVVMGLEHQELPIYGLQFHPESILSRYGKDILMNFLKF
ncbi:MULTISPECIES: anthranilate synthase component II [unclassified Helicobacter]|uniref:anthranilate synthase component II n=1 Tax=unclassified Helicobacter TaxID=2593540 RepID=UPI000CF07FD6|nr:MULTISPECIES: aminodeoxychorismate/anthranilate synthase component II [unclassified Helicobacter]